jgi:hypothetical protein
MTNAAPLFGIIFMNTPTHACTFGKVPGAPLGIQRNLGNHTVAYVPRRHKRQENCVINSTGLVGVI